MSQEISNQAAAELTPIDGGREQVRVADLLDLTQGTFLFEPADQGLNGCGSNALLLGQTGWSSSGFRGRPES